jgi:hypothetical protein
LEIKERAKMGHLVDIDCVLAFMDFLRLPQYKDKMKSKLKPELMPEVEKAALEINAIYIIDKFFEEDTKVEEAVQKFLEQRKAKESQDGKVRSGGPDRQDGQGDIETAKRSGPSASDGQRLDQEERGAAKSLPEDQTERRQDGNETDG